MTATIEQIFSKIAEKHLNIETLETRHSDRLDFHDVSVWGVRSALEAAFQAGLEVGMSSTATEQSGLRNS